MLYPNNSHLLRLGQELGRYRTIREEARFCP